MRSTRNTPWSAVESMRASNLAVTQLKHMILDEDTRAREQSVFAGLQQSHP